MYDAMDRLALECEVSFTCIGAGGEFVLLDNSAPDHSVLTAKASANGWAFCGIFGLQAGVPRVESEPDAASRYTMLHAGLEFCHIVAGKLREPEKGDSVNWLRNLHALPDTRRCVNG